MKLKSIFWLLNSKLTNHNSDNSSNSDIIQVISESKDSIEDQLPEMFGEWSVYSELFPEENND